MTKNTLTGLLVGMNFRPPAKLFLECLAGGTELQLVHEPDNEYDSNAVRVYVQLADTAPSQRSRLESELPNFGWDIEDFDRRADLGEAFMLGYLAAEGNKQRAKMGENIVANTMFLAAQEQIAWSECKITLGFANSGAPLVVMTAQETAEQQ